MLNTALLSHPINWVTIWTMLAIGGLVYITFKRGMAASTEA